MIKRNQQWDGTTCCKCNNPLEPNRIGKQGYCKACKNQHQQAQRTRDRYLRLKQSMPELTIERFILFYKDIRIPRTTKP